MRLDPPRTLADLADWLGEEIRDRLAELGSPGLNFEVTAGGDTDVLIEAVCPVEEMVSGGLAFAVKQSYLDEVEAGPAAAVIVPPNLTPKDMPYIAAPEPRLAFTVVMELAKTYAGPVSAADNSIRFKDKSTVSIGKDTVIGDFTYIGADVRIGEGCRIYPHVFIDDNVEIGDGCILYPHVTVLRKSVLGKKVILHSGVVIGGDGFSYSQYPDYELGRLHHMKNEHAGGVRLGDFVELGNQVCVDRGLVRDTVIGKGTKVDNLVQIAHNCQIGQDCIVVAQVGMAGHSCLGDRVFALGQAGFTTGAKVGDDAIIGAKAGVSGEIPAGRMMWTGVPAQKGDDEYKQVALARRELPRVREFFRLLKKADSLEALKDAFFKSKK